MKPVINSEKRIVQTTLTEVMAGAVGNINLINCVQDPTASAPQEIRAGTVVKAVYLEYWLLASSQQPSTQTLLIEKLSSGQVAVDTTQIANLNGYENKKNILETHQGLVGDANSNPIPVFRGWVKIPKGKQRFGFGDKLTLTLKSITEDTQLCGIAIFKAYN